jgi:hypothetical protein
VRRRHLRPASATASRRAQAYTIRYSYSLTQPTTVDVMMTRDLTDSRMALPSTRTAPNPNSHQAESGRVTYEARLTISCLVLLPPLLDRVCHPCCQSWSSSVVTSSPLSTSPSLSSSSLSRLLPWSAAPQASAPQLALSISASKSSSSSPCTCVCARACVRASVREECERMGDLAGQGACQARNGTN